MGLEQLKQLQESGQNKSIRADNFYVEDGILSCNNYFIPLEAVSSVTITKKANLSVLAGVFCIVIGILALLIPVDPVQMIGLLLLLIGVINIVVVTMKNNKKEYYLTIRLNNNEVRTFISDKEEFLQQVMTVMKHCINDRKGVYNVNFGEQNIKYSDDHSIGKTNIEGISAGGDVVFSGSIGNTKTIGRDNIENNVTGDNNAVEIRDGLTENEWNILEKFFAKKVESSDTQGNNHRVYVQIEQVVKERNEAKLIAIFKKLGQAAVNVMLSGVGDATKNAVGSILMKLIQ